MTLFTYYVFRRTAALKWALFSFLYWKSAAHERDINLNFRFVSYNMYQEPTEYSDSIRLTKYSASIIRFGFGSDVDQVCRIMEYAKAGEATHHDFYFYGYNSCPGSYFCTKFSGNVEGI